MAHRVTVGLPPNTSRSPESRISTAATPRTGAVLADLLPAARSGYAVDTALVVGGALLTGLAAQLAVPVSGSPVPVTGQTFAALLVGASLGARRGFLSLSLYALAGMAGLPWFAGGTSGAGGVSFGTSWACCSPRRWGRTGPPRWRPDDAAPHTAVTMVLGSAVIYAVGVPYLALSAGMSRDRRALGWSGALPARRRAQGRAGHGC